MAIPTTLMVAMETIVVIEGVIKLVLLHITVLPFIAAAMFTVKMEDRQYVGSDDCMLELCKVHMCCSPQQHIIH